MEMEMFLKALILIGDDVLKEKLYYNENFLQIFSLLRVSNSLLFIEHTGYVRFIRDENKISLMKSIHNPKYANKILHDNFIELKTLYNINKNNKYDKAVCLDFLRISNEMYRPIFSKVTEGYELFEVVFDKLLNNEYFNDSQKSKIEAIRKELTKNHKINR